MSNLTNQTGEAEREAVKALLKLDAAYREQGAACAPATRQRERFMARAKGTREAIKAIHAHQTERITVHATDPLKHSNRKDRS